MSRVHYTELYLEISKKISLFVANTLFLFQDITWPNKGVVYGRLVIEIFLCVLKKCSWNLVFFQKTEFCECKRKWCGISWKKYATILQKIAKTLHQSVSRKNGKFSWNAKIAARVLKRRARGREALISKIEF